MLFDRPSPKVLLDTNAVRDFFREGRELTPDELIALRDACREKASAGLIRFVMTQPILWELAPMASAPDAGMTLYEQTLRFYVDIAHRWLSLHEHERERFEMALRRPLRDREVLQAHADPDGLIRTALSDDWIRLQTERLRAQGASEREEEAARREATVAALEQKFADWRAQLTAEFSPARWEQTVSHNVRVELRKWARRKGIATRGAGWPHPKAARTFWFSESFYAANVLSVFLGRGELTSKSSIKAMPGLLDSTHFRDAAYADVFVTRDEGFREVANAARTGLVILSFEEFARAILP